MNYLARPERFELPTPWFVARYSIQLSYGRVQKAGGNAVGFYTRKAANLLKSKVFLFPYYPIDSKARH
jgi:hypothetical protein